MDARAHARKAAETMAHMYVWETVLSILHGSATPDRQDAKAGREVQRVTRIARSEIKRLAGFYDEHFAAITELTEDK